MYNTIYTCYLNVFSRPAHANPGGHQYGSALNGITPYIFSIKLINFIHILPSYTVSVLGREGGYTVKYTPLPK